MEVTVVDCFHSDSLLSKPITSISPCTIYFLRIGGSFPSQRTSPLSINNLQSSLSPQAYHILLENEVELGFRLCQLCYMTSNLTVHTTKAELFSQLGVSIIGEVEKVRPRETEDLAQVARNAALIEVKKKGMEKYKLQLQFPAMQRPTKVAKAKNVLNGLISGIYTSKSVYTEGLEGPEAVTEALFTKLEEMGVITTYTNGTISYNDENIRRLCTDKEFFQKLVEDRPSAQAEPAAVEPRSNAVEPRYSAVETRYTAEEPRTEKYPVTEIANDVYQYLICEVNQTLTVGLLYECVNYYTNARLGTSDKLCIGQVLRLLLQYLELPVNTDPEDVVLRPERYRSILLSYRS